VTLGSTLTEAGERHPKVRRDATICAGATILGNIEIGAGAVVAASSVVLQSVPAGMMVAGIPAKVVGRRAKFAAISPGQSFGWRGELMIPPRNVSSESIILL